MPRRSRGPFPGRPSVSVTRSPVSSTQGDQAAAVGCGARQFGTAHGRAAATAVLTYRSVCHATGRRMPRSWRTSSATTSSRVASTQPALQSWSRPLTLPMNAAAGRR